MNVALREADDACVTVRVPPPFRPGKLMKTAAVLKIIENPAHPMRPEIASRVSDLLSRDLYAVAFSWAVDPVPGNARLAKAPGMLAGLLKGESEGTAAVTEFIKRNSFAFSRAFPLLLAATRAEAAKLADAPKA